MLFRAVCRKRGIPLFIALFFVSSLQFYCYAGERPTVTLEVIRAIDHRLPTLSDEDMKQILDEAKRIIYIKLGDKIEIDFHDNGTISLPNLFKNYQYQSSKFYKDLKDWKYNLNNPPDLDKDKKYIIDFLKQWELDSLKDFFPDRQIRSYDDFYKILTITYHKKIKWLKSLKTYNGANLIIQPPVSFQSYVEWLSLMWYQDKYDIIFTNTLIVYDLFSEPYPHTICKHAKAGGSSCSSPKRKPLDGRSLVVNIFEEYGNIEGIKPATDVPKATKNKILGGFYFAHEFGHAFYYIPDVYDHSNACLMNSSLSNMEGLKGYNAIISNLSMCQKCQPWIIAKEYVICAQNAYRKKDYARSGNMYIQAVSKTPKIIDGDYNGYVIGLYEKALDAYTKAKDKNNIRRCKGLIKNQK